MHQMYHTSTHCHLLPAAADALRDLLVRCCCCCVGGVGCWATGEAAGSWFGAVVAGSAAKEQWVYLRVSVCVCACVCLCVCVCVCACVYVRPWWVIVRVCWPPVKQANRACPTYF